VQLKYSHGAASTVCRPADLQKLLFGILVSQAQASLPVSFCLLFGPLTLNAQYDAGGRMTTMTIAQSLVLFGSLSYFKKSWPW